MLAKMNEKLGDAKHSMCVCGCNCIHLSFFASFQCILAHILVYRRKKCFHRMSLKENSFLQCLCLALVCLLLGLLLVRILVQYIRSLWCVCVCVYVGPCCSFYIQFVSFNFFVVGCWLKSTRLCFTQHQ